jgi:hypothetical protein
VGDGFSSGVWQGSDLGVAETTICTLPVAQMADLGLDVLSCRNDVDKTNSWLGVAALQAHSEFSVPPAWEVDVQILARPGTTSAALLAPGGQVEQMKTLLAQHTGSWNVVGITAGFDDLGIGAAITSSYGTGTPTNLPWAPATLSSCPDLTSARATLDSAGAVSAVKSNIQAVIDAARAPSIDPSVRALHLLYPFITDVTAAGAGSTRSLCASGGTGRPGSEQVINDLDQGIRGVVGTAVIDARLPSGFGLQPTGYVDTPNGQLPQNNTYLWLNRTHGYPYPGDNGAGKAAGLALPALRANGSGVAPTITAQVPAITTTNGNPAYGWFKLAPTISWDVRDADGDLVIDDPSRPLPAPTVADIEGQDVTYHSGNAWDAAGHMATKGSATVSFDKTKPTLTPVVTQASGLAAKNGWFNTDVSVTWTADDATSGLDLALGKAIVNPLPLAADTPVTGTTLSATAWDKAGNSVDASTIVRLDKTPPAVVPHVAGTLVGGWYRGTVSVTWTATDARSGIDPEKAPSLVPVSVLGTGSSKVVTGPDICDLAGNCAPATATLNVDQTAPIVTLVGPQSGAVYTSLAAVPAATCTASDVGSGINGTCTVNKAFTQSGTTQTWTITATATDKAGNSFTTPAITYTVTGVSNGNGRMTGGGTVRSTSGVRAVTAYALRCSGTPNVLDVFWGSERFTLTSLTSVTCYDDPSFEAGGNALINTMTGVGVGKLRSGGTATIGFTFTDHGEPGTYDTGTIVITPAGGGAPFSITGQLSAGNYQAHRLNDSEGYSAADYEWHDDHGSHDVWYGRDGTCHYRSEGDTGHTYHEVDARNRRRTSWNDKKGSRSDEGNGRTEVR